MKKAHLGLVVAALAFALCTPPRAEASVSVTVSIGHFYDELAPYGRWVTVDRWGECWAPSVATTWQPYENGEWLYTDYGFTWVSYDPWGGDPFHYGSWAWDPEFGWIWVPGTVWAPAWVTWSYTDTYVGWAPLPPSFTFTASGYSGALVEPARSYVFVPARSFVGTSVSTVRIAPERNVAILPAARPVTRLAVSGGVVRNTALAPSQVERLVGHRIAPVPISRARVSPVSLRASGVSGSRFALAAPAATRHAALAPHVSRGRGATAERRDVSRGAAMRETRTTHGRETRTAPMRETRAARAPRETRGGPPARETRPRDHVRESVHVNERSRSHARAAAVSRPIERPSRPERLDRPAPRHEAPPPAVRHEAPPQRHEAPPPRAAAPPVRHEPPVRVASRPEPGPRAEAPAHHEPPPQAHAPGAPGGGAPPPQHGGPPPQARGKGHDKKHE